MLHKTARTEIVEAVRQGQINIFPPGRVQRKHGVKRKPRAGHHGQRARRRRGIDQHTDGGQADAAGSVPARQLKFVPAGR